MHTVSSGRWRCAFCSCGAGAAEREWQRWMAAQREETRKAEAEARHEEAGAGQQLDAEVGMSRAVAGHDFQGCDVAFVL